MTSRATASIPALCLVLLLASPAPAADPDVPLREALTLQAGPGGRGGRSLVHRDAVEAALVAGTWKMPKAGEKFPVPGREPATWKPLQPNKDGAYNPPPGAYTSFTVTLPEPRTLLLEAAGHGTAYVNGAPYTGDPYGYGYLHLPVHLRKGDNELLFSPGRGALRVKLVAPKADVFVDTADDTLPDLLAGQEMKTWGAVVVTNAIAEWVDGLELESRIPGTAAVRTPLPPLAPLACRKVGFRIEGKVSEGKTCDIALRLLKGAAPRDTTKVTVGVRQPHETHKRTFVSGIDGSVQYYALVPAKAPGSQPLSLILTLHGASVEAMGQAAAYAAKDWAHIVAPTNRRPFGFDWEDWGRLDALEVLDLAQKELHTDPRRTYLTGHSMGGHGTWHLGVLYPDRFAAIGPSAGWVSMYSYAGARRPEHPDPVQEMFLRAASPSDTLALESNYAMEGVYVLHGDKDDNVPVTQARTMKKQLEAFHKDLKYHEEPNVGHWWGKEGISGAACVDWPEMFTFFKAHQLPRPADVHKIDFVTPSPGVSAWCHWACVAAQAHALQPSRIRLTYDPTMKRIAGTTENTLRLVLDLPQLAPGGPASIELDGQTLRVDEPQQPLHLARTDGRWSIAPPPVGGKGPQRYGPFKDAFRNRMLFVYSTKGTPEENAWSYAKARFDAETFRYRGNGSIDLVPDDRFDAGATADRNVIVYGNADTNGAWSTLLADSPVQVRRGGVSIGDREEKGADLACLFVRPRRGSDRALVGVVAGTGPAGMRLTDRLPYFVSGVGVPDCVVLDSTMLTQGEPGIRAAGFFGPDWGAAKGDWAWRK